MGSGAGEVRTERRPVCIVCGAASSRVRYANQTDRLFSAGGQWNLVECSNPRCGVLWLDPAPVPEDLPLLYRDYYTHEAEPAHQRSRLNQFFQRAEDAYLAEKYGYGEARGTALACLEAALMYLRPSRRAALDFDVFYLRAQPGGHLLEVGCGSGAMLRRMQERGWQVEGVDFDPQAVVHARVLGLKVRAGDILKMSLPAGKYDVVAMSHVIEHVPDPHALLGKCARLLKPGARVVIITPNVKAVSHRLFGRHWRGLEPPRHLQLFAASPLRRLCHEAGLEVEVCRSSMRGARGIFAASIRLMQAGRSRPVSCAPAGVSRGAALWELLAITVLSLVPGLGDEIVCIARKPDIAEADSMKASS